MYDRQEDQKQRRGFGVTYQGIVFKYVEDAHMR
jgi:hypothetical protein